MSDPVDLACFAASTESGQLYLIYSAITGGSDAGQNVNVTNTCLSVQPCPDVTFTVAVSGVQDAITRGAYTNTQTIAAGYKCITVFTSSDWVGNVQGIPFPANATETYPAQVGDTLGTLLIEPSVGTLYFSTIG